jgi:hypothetical protein
MTDTEREKLVDDALAVLSEHFDHVQILATWSEPGVTKDCFRGEGNWYARQGMCREFLSRDKAQVVAKEIGDVLNDEDEDE